MIGMSLNAKKYTSVYVIVLGRVITESAYFSFIVGAGSA